MNNVIVTKNTKSHAAAKARKEVQDCYSILDQVKKLASWDNTNYKMERSILGDKYVDDMITEVNKREAKALLVVNGTEIMKMLDIKSGPIVGQILKHITTSKLTREQALEFIRTYKTSTITTSTSAPSV